MIEFGFMMGLSPREPIARFADLARRAEDLGFDMAWLADSPLYTKDVFVALTLAAAATGRIRLGPGVANPVTRHFTILANSMAALNEVSGGRAHLGLGVGDAAVTPLGLKRATLDEIRQTTQRIRTLAAGGAVTVEGHQIRIQAGGAGCPILISASQPKMLRLAGEIADGVVLMGAATPELTQWQLDHVARGAAEVGRSLKDVFVDLWFAISVSDDRDRALRDVRPWATSQARSFATWRELPAALRPFRGDFATAARGYDFSAHLSRHRGDAEGVSEEFVDWVAVAGPLEACVAKIRPLLDLKVDRITFALLPGGREERVRQYGHDLIPRLRAVRGVNLSGHG